MFKNTLTLCFCLAFAAFAKATTRATPQRDTFISSIILLRNGDTLKVCDAKVAEKDIEFRYCDRPKRVKIISKAEVLRVVTGRNKLIFENPIVQKDQTIKPRLAVFHPFLGGIDEYVMGNESVNPYTFEKELIPNVKAGEARRDAIHKLYKKAEATGWLSWGVLVVGGLLGFFAPIIAIIALIVSLICSITALVQKGNAQSMYKDMVDEYNHNQGYN